ncbi:aminoacyl-tRNA hydrolase [Methylomarinum sp. Ch1-1]|uniref:Peptidyl-tRNA hydrolase n=1 Tax=Methylomarinum roseum TaxID=3067653 RepID=A0AAU7NV88_9GAMM|nr:aminoacyl-tRNA hydrolase [Methylomarinum sp. Ch1-1]MDP4519037.1 aminoacyl-tRNA hydrolase [Methylomarinum sp. Ch1-1]
MIRLIVGLGNPGRKYEKTRHNVGFLFLERLAGVGVWSNEARFQGLLASCRLGAHQVVLLKPQTYMNNSGASVGKVARYYKIAPEEILVVHDELDFDEGVIRVKKGGGHAGHNGLRDIVAHLGSRDFMRLRVGIGRPPVGQAVSDYVLSRPTSEGCARIERAFDEVESLIGSVVDGDIDLVMRELHG